MLLLPCLFLLLLQTVCHATNMTDDLDPSKFLVYGPGLYTNFVLPVRYVFIQLVDKTGNNVTTSRGDDLINANMVLRKDHVTSVRGFHDIQDLHDGSYVARFRLVSSVLTDDVELVLTMGPARIPIGRSPYILQAPLYAETCDCPSQTLADFLRQLDCPANYSQIDDDLAQFENIDMAQVSGQFGRFFTNPHAVAVCRYIVKDNKVHRKCFGEHTGFTMFSDHALLSMARKTRLPDLDFLMNLGDWPLSVHEQGLHFPVLSWCGSHRSSDIVLPSYEAMEWTLNMMSRLSLDVFTALNTPHLDWTTKRDLAFWRGRDSSQTRLNLVKYSLGHPRDVDARLTAMFFFANNSEVGERSPQVSFHDFFRYRYQVNLDGTVAAYRLALLLAGGSLVFKQDSVFYEHFYSQLKPMEHFVPLAGDISDFPDRLKWARENVDEAEAIGRRGREFIRTSLLPRDVLCYYGRVLEGLSTRIASKIVVPPGFERVETAEHADPIEECECREESLVNKETRTVKDEL